MIFLLACGTEQALTSTPKTPEATSESLGPTELLVRASLDLRGIRPSEEELLSVQNASNPETKVWDSIEEYLYDPRFGPTLRDRFADIYLTRQDAWYVTASDYGLANEPAFARAAGEEPLQILSYIAENDLPYYNIVTADWTMAEETLGQSWPLDYPSGTTGWQQVHYTDGRPTAGILSANGMWWRFMSNGSNGNRARANAISRILLCNDYLSKPITFDRNVDILDGDALRDALQNNPGCYSCHESLDPFAAYFWGFFYYDYSSANETSFYHAEREGMWMEYTEVAPAYYGEPGYTLNDLGQQLAADPRLPLCMTEQAYTGLIGKKPGLDETGDILQHRDAFLQGGATLRALYRSILQDPDYRQGARQVSVAQLASQVEEITGFHWTYYGYEMMNTDTYGLRVLAGGVDGAFVTAPATTPTATGALVWERFAQAAAWYVVEQDRTSQTPRLFENLGATPQSDRTAVVEQLQKLHRILYGNFVASDGPEVEAGIALWEALYAEERSVSAAWAGVLSVMMRDPEFLFY